MGDPMPPTLVTNSACNWRQLELLILLPLSLILGITGRDLHHCGLCGIKVMTSCMQDKYSTYWTTPPAHNEHLLSSNSNLEVRPICRLCLYSLIKNLRVCWAGPGDAEVDTSEDHYYLGLWFHQDDPDEVGTCWTSLIWKAWAGSLSELIFFVRFWNIYRFIMRHPGSETHA